MDDCAVAFTGAHAESYWVASSEVEESPLGVIIVRGDAYLLAAVIVDFEIDNIATVSTLAEVESPLVLHSGVKVEPFGLVPVGFETDPLVMANKGL